MKKTIENITAEMTALVDGAAGRTLTDEECGAYEALESDLKAAQRAESIGARHAAYNRVEIPAGRPATPQDDTYEKAFNNYMRTGKPNGDLITAAQSEGVPTEGGYLVPQGFRTKLVERMKAFGGIGGIAERYTTGTGNPTEWPTIDDTANVAEIVQEGNTFSAGADLVFGTNSLGSYAYVAGGGASTPLRVSLELLQDSAFDVQGLLSRLLGTRIGRIQATHLATGTGVNQPLGLITGKTPVQNAANTGIAYADLVNGIHSVDPAYRTNARWVMNDATLGQIELLTDSQGNPIYRGRDVNLATGFNEATLLGYPVTIDQAMPAFVKNSATSVWAAFGDIRTGYVVRDVQDVQLLVNPYNRMAYRQVEFTAWARMDATQQDTNAYVTLSGHV